MTTTNPGTRWYVVAQDGTDRSLAEQACLAVLDVVRPRAERASIDAYSDYQEHLTVAAQVAQDALRSRGAARRRGNPGMGVELDPARPQDWDLLRAFASWSIHVELDSAEGVLAVLHDSGRSVGAELSQAEAEQLSRLLAGTLRVEALAPRRRWGRHRRR